VRGWCEWRWRGGGGGGSGLSSVFSVGGTEVQPVSCEQDDNFEDRRFFAPLGSLRLWG